MARKRTGFDAAWSALNLLDSPIKETLAGDVEGVEYVEAGIEAMADALLTLKEVELKGMTGATLAEVLAELAESGSVSTELAEDAGNLELAIANASYSGGGGAANIEATEELRRRVYDALSDVLSSWEESEA